MYLHGKWASQRLERASVLSATSTPPHPPHPPIHTFFTHSHHYRHHRLHLIKDFPPWLTPRLPALLKKEEGWLNKCWPVVAEKLLSLRGGGVQKRELQTRLERVPGCNKGENLQSVTVSMHYLSDEPRLTGMCTEKCLVETRSGLSTCQSSSEEDLQLKYLDFIYIYLYIYIYIDIYRYI